MSCWKVMGGKKRYHIAEDMQSLFGIHEGSVPETIADAETCRYKNLWVRELQ